VVLVRDGGLLGLTGGMAVLAIPLMSIALLLVARGLF